MKHLNTSNCYLNLFQHHMCSLPGDHLAGLDCLSDELVLPLLLAMDSESLLKVGRTSQRLFSLVCDRQVWRHLLKGLDFTEEQMLEQVLTLLRLPKMMDSEAKTKGIFEFWSNENPEMMSEILKEMATRSIYLTGTVKLKIEIQSWGAPETFEVDASYLGELRKVAFLVKAKFNITEVHIPLWNLDTLDSIARAYSSILVQIEGQEGALLELKLGSVSDCANRDISIIKYIQILQKACRTWSIQYFKAGGVVPWRTLARFSANGRIGLIIAFKAQMREIADQDDVKSVWKITRRFRVLNLDDFGGGLGEEVELPGHFNKHTHHMIFDSRFRRKDIFRDENGSVILPSLGLDAESEWQRMSQVIFNF